MIMPQPLHRRQNSRSFEPRSPREDWRLRDETFRASSCRATRDPRRDVSAVEVDSLYPLISTHTQPSRKADAEHAGSTRLRACPFGILPPCSVAMLVRLGLGGYREDCCQITARYVTSMRPTSCSDSGTEAWVVVKLSLPIRKTHSHGHDPSRASSAPPLTVLGQHSSCAAYSLAVVSRDRTAGEQSQHPLLQRNTGATTASPLRIFSSLA